MFSLCVVNFAVEELVPQEAGCVAIEQRVAHGAPQAIRVPASIRHLKDEPIADDFPAATALCWHDVGPGGTGTCGRVPLRRRGMHAVVSRPGRGALRRRRRARHHDRCGRRGLYLKNKDMICESFVDVQTSRRAVHRRRKSSARQVGDSDNAATRC